MDKSLTRKQRRQLERKLVKAKRNAWTHKQKVRRRNRSTYENKFIFVLDSNIDRCNSSVDSIR